MAALHVALLCAFITVYVVVGQMESGEPDASRRFRREHQLCNATGTCCQFWKAMNDSLYSSFTNCSGSPAGIVPPPCVGPKGPVGGPRHRPGSNKMCVWECVYTSQGVFNNGSLNVAAFQDKIKSILASDTNCFDQLSAPITKCLNNASPAPEKSTCSHIPFFLNHCISGAARKVCADQNRKPA